MFRISVEYLPTYIKMFLDGNKKMRIAHCAALWGEIEGFIIIKKFLLWDLCLVFFKNVMDYDYSFFGKMKKCVFLFKSARLH